MLNYVGAYLAGMVTARAMTEDAALSILWGEAGLWMCEECGDWYPESHMQNSEGLCASCVDEGCGPRRDCPSCDGDGRNDCSQCDGLGTVDP